jgi:hypothetical protein
VVSDILPFNATKDLATLVKRRRARKDSIQQIPIAEPQISDQITTHFPRARSTPIATFSYIDRKASSNVTCQELKRNRLERKDETKRMVMKARADPRISILLAQPLRSGFFTDVSVNANTKEWSADGDVPICLATAVNGVKPLPTANQLRSTSSCFGMEHFLRF